MRDVQRLRGECSMPGNDQQDSQNGVRDFDSLRKIVDDKARIVRGRIAKHDCRAERDQQERQVAQLEKEIRQ